MGKFRKKLKRQYINYLLQKESKHYLRKINQMPVNTSYRIQPEVLKRYRENWAALFGGKINERWLQWYCACNNNQSPDYVPENVYYTTIEPILNDRRFSKGYSDKNSYDLMYPRGIFPHTILRNIGGSYFDIDYTPLKIEDNSQLLKILGNADQFILKPAIDSGGGEKVNLFQRREGILKNTDDQELTLHYLEKHYQRNFLFQHKIRNHFFLDQFNKSSLNTIRFTLIRNPISYEFEFIQSYLRIGGIDSHLDNMRSGGFAIGIDSAGTLMPFAVEKKGAKIKKVHEIDLSANNYTIPFFDLLTKTALEIARKNIHHKIIALDMTLDEFNQARCVEINNESIGINHVQLTCGPLFGHLTRDIINYCIKHRDSLYA